MKTIWVLVQIANNYDQPDNDLVTWFSQEPTVEQLIKFVGDEKTAKQLSENKVTSDSHAYYLKQVNEGEYVP